MHIKTSRRTIGDWVLPADNPAGDRLPLAAGYVTSSAAAELLHSGATSAGEPPVILERLPSEI
jgi:hypothetical protein